MPFLLPTSHLPFLVCEISSSAPGARERDVRFSREPSSQSSLVLGLSWHVSTIWQEVLPSAEVDGG